MVDFNRKDSTLIEEMFSKSMISEGEVNFDCLKCIICLRISRSPKKISCCDIICCSDCLEEWLKSSNSCLICRKGSPQIVAVSKFILRVYDTLKFYCYFRKNGCNERNIPYKELENHTNFCEFNPNGRKRCKKCLGEYESTDIHDCLSSLILRKDLIKDQISFFEDYDFIENEVLRNIKKSYL